VSEILKNVMPPPWIKYPALSEFSLGWRMGAGQTISFQAGVSLGLGKGE